MKKRGPEITNLQQLLDRIEEASLQKERITFGMILQAVGRRSFGPMLLLAGLIILAPLIGDIPGVPTTMALFVLLIAGQLLVGRKHFWLPQWIVRRSVTHNQLRKALRWLRPSARFLDRWFKPRLTFLTQDGGTYLIALACILIAAATPPMELIPFSANGAGIALIAFGLALIAHDGLLALLALAVMGTTFGLIIYNLF